jgi:hypothetical protein
MQILKKLYWCRHIYDFMNYADSVPLSSCVISAFTTATFALTSIAAGLLTISTASLQSVDTFTRSSSFLIVDPVRNLFVRYLTWQLCIWFILTNWMLNIYANYKYFLCSRSDNNGSNTTLMRLIFVNHAENSVPYSSICTS